MIIDRFENIDLYFDKASRLYEAVCYTRDFDCSQSDGNYVVNGDSFKAGCNTYLTKLVAERSFESHIKYIDIQVILEGEEMMGHTFDNDLEISKEYNEEMDVRIYNRPKKYNSIIMKPGYFVVFFPHDLHMPNCMVEKQEKVRKLVVKVRI